MNTCDHYNNVNTKAYVKSLKSVRKHVLRSLQLLWRPCLTQIIRYINDLIALKVIQPVAAFYRQRWQAPDVPSELAKRVICACIREICFFRDFMGLKRQKFSWSLLARHLYTRQLACEPQTGCTFQILGGGRTSHVPPSLPPP